MAVIDLIALEQGTPQWREPNPEDTVRLPLSNTQTTGSIAGLSILPVYNQASGDAANTDLLINRTETAVGSGAQLLMDLQVGSVSKLSVRNDGKVTAVIFTASGANGYNTGSTYLIDGSSAISNATTYMRQKIHFRKGTASEIIVATQNTDAATGGMTLRAGHAYPSAVTNLDGAALTLAGGAGASGSAGDADGGDVNINGGQEYGTGDVGNIKMTTLPTSDPGVAGALWANSAVVTVSAG